jgi:hypothetical protein
MRTIRCIVCKQDIGLYGWAKHVAREKRVHGDDVYRVLKGNFLKPEKFKFSIIEMTKTKPLSYYDENKL